MKRYLHDELNDTTTVKGKMLHSLREIVFGLEDGIVSTLGAITGIAGATQNSTIVILTGIVIIFVESLSMAAGTFLSSKSEKEVERHMLSEEAEEIELHPELERKELEDFYLTRGFTVEETAVVVNRVTSDKKLWLEEMAYRELGIIPGQDGTPKTDALFMGLSYILGGVIPLCAYFLLPIATALPVSLVSSILALFIVGAVKGKIVRTSKIRSGVEMVAVSFAAAGIGYAVGQIASRYLGI